MLLANYVAHIATFLSPEQVNVVLISGARYQKGTDIQDYRFR